MNLTRTMLVSGAALAGLLASPACAEEATTDTDQKDTVTVTATRVPVATQDAPATVSVIDAEQIADELVTDIKELVRFEPGVSVTRQPTRFGAALGTTGRAGNEGFTIRGLGGNRVLIQVDGVRVPDGFSFGAQGVGRGDYVDLGLIKSVEILRGPASALYGSDGLAGAVSFITSDPKDLLREGQNFGGLARAAFSSADDEFSETLILAGRSGDWSAMAAYTRRDFHEYENQGTVGGEGAARTQPNPQDGRSNAALGRLVYESGGHRFRLTGEYLDTHLTTDVLTGHSASVLNLDATDTGHRWRAALDWNWEGEGLIEAARLAAYLQDSEDSQFTFEDRDPAVDRTRLNIFKNRVYGAAGEVRLNLASAEAPQRIILGGDISQTEQQGIRDGTIPPFGETFPTRAFPDTDYTLIGVFAAGEATLGPVTLHPALRFDHYDLSPDMSQTFTGVTAVAQSGSRVSPKIGAVAKLSDRVRLFANYAQGFKAPEPSQVNQFFGNLAFGYIAAPNPDLRPETSASFEAGVRFLGANVRLDLTAFHADYDDFISQEVVGGSFTPADPAIYQFINIDKAEVEGVEARFEAWSDSGFTGRLAISYASGDEIAPGGTRSPLLSVDPLKVVIGAGWRDPGGRFGGQVIATHSAKKETDRAGGGYTPPSFTTLDITAFVKIGDSVTLRGGVFNLTDETYAWWSDVRGLSPTSTIKDAYTQPGRNGSVSLSFRF
ncbi:TonB-dependent hemoglobin/transferrin/lactoferrin family receptor [Sphingomonas suaedae]|uniref:TonB-dependent hemoglobin/transferrin/lactoferrin family receptor n=1 Tax=Sphingomonas suaedae TaxID=2599297 RepID=A0A518RG44_9SPHN|nr:TonB-dependent hemoglobin/transferrin/lactoferrin family receptor [Sphingomonas suaedae]QDX26425.1 TonB-dependent hemoglobin/transferrin/lactoferrin family receptor [Sphingomonas suaedae]